MWRINGFVEETDQRIAWGTDRRIWLKRINATDFGGNGGRVTPRPEVARGGERDECRLLGVEGGAGINAGRAQGGDGAGEADGCHQRERRCDERERVEG
jgi:hypothetical protein